jgi:putative lipase involved disintegration of autophagic bodies
MSVHELQLEHMKQHLQTVVNQVMDIYEAILEKITKPNMIHNYESKFN